LGNEREDLQEEVEGWSRRIQLVMEGLGEHWLAVSDGQFATGAGEIDDADLTLTLSAEEAAQVFAGDKDAKAAYLSGALQVKGELPDAVKVQALIEIVVEEIEF
jgi:putative sterol carrier protein